MTLSIDGSAPEGADEGLLPLLLNPSPRQEIADRKVSTHSPSPACGRGQGWGSSRSRRTSYKAKAVKRKVQAKQSPRPARLPRGCAPDPLRTSMRAALTGVFRCPRRYGGWGPKRHHKSNRHTSVTWIESACADDLHTVSYGDGVCVYL